MFNRTNVLFALLLIVQLVGVVSATIYDNGTISADTYLRQKYNTTNYGSKGYFNIYGTSTNRATAIMEFTLPNGTGNITQVTLNLYVRDKWDNWPTTPVELHVLNEDFNEIEATWDNNTATSAWSNPGAWTPNSSDPTIVDSVLINHTGWYTFVLNGTGAQNSIPISWGQTIRVSLMLPKERHRAGVKILSKEYIDPYYRPYITVVADETLSLPKILNVSVIKTTSYSALIKVDTDVESNIWVEYGTNLRHLKAYSTGVHPSSVPKTKEGYLVLTGLTPNTTYYIKVHATNFADNNLASMSDIITISTKERVSKVPLVTFVFDDNRKGVYTDAFPILSKAGFPAVIATVTDSVGKYQRMSWSELKFLQDKFGWEIASHTKSHIATPKCNYAYLEYQLRKSKQILESHGLTVNNFVAPGGYWNVRTEGIIARYYNSDRTISGGPMTSPYNEYPLWAVKLIKSTSVNDAKSYVDEAIAKNGWVIFYSHNISKMPTDIDWYTSNLSKLVDYIESRGEVRVVTIQDGLTKEYDNKYLFMSTDNKTLINTVFANGTVKYSKCPTGHVKLTSFHVMPTVTVNVIVYGFSQNRVHFTVESPNGGSVKFNLCSLHPNKVYIVIRDGIELDRLISNSTGCIHFDNSERIKRTFVVEYINQPSNLSPTSTHISSYSGYSSPTPKPSVELTQVSILQHGLTYEEVLAMVLAIVILVAIIWIWKS